MRSRVPRSSIGIERMTYARQVLPEAVNLRRVPQVGNGLPVFKIYDEYVVLSFQLVQEGVEDTNAVGEAA